MSWWTELCTCCSCGERPGGFELTQKAVEFCGFTRASNLIDVACGDGATMRQLQEKLGCSVVGVDSDPSRQGENIVLGQAQDLPFPDGCADGVLIECGLSQMEQPDQVFAQCARVLRPGGKLIVSDLYARKGGACPDSPMGRLDDQDAIQTRLEEHGFTLLLFEDQSAALTQLWAQALMSGQGEELFQKMRSDPVMSKVKAGYYLCIAEK